MHCFSVLIFLLSNKSNIKLKYNQIIYQVLCIFASTLLCNGKIVLFSFSSSSSAGFSFGCSLTLLPFFLFVGVSSFDGVLLLLTVFGGSGFFFELVWGEALALVSLLPEGFAGAAAAFLDLGGGDGDLAFFLFGGGLGDFTLRPLAGGGLGDFALRPLDGGGLGDFALRPLAGGGLGAFFLRAGGGDGVLVFRFFGGGVGDLALRDRTGGGDGDFFLPVFFVEGDGSFTGGCFLVGGGVGGGDGCRSFWRLRISDCFW